jgi:hypothetical protein
MQAVDTTTTDTPAPTNEEIATARANLKKYQDVAADAEAARDRWRTAFEREPTVEARDNRDIWAQKSINARAAADTYERETLTPLIAQQRRATIARHEAELMAQQRQAVASLEGAFDQLVSAIEAFDGAISEFESLHYAQIRASQQGVGLSAAFSLRREIERLAPRLQRFGGQAGHHVAGANAASVTMTQPDQNEAHLAIRVARKCVGVPMPTRNQ